MGMIKLLRPGTWWITSKSDPRWNESGPSDSVGMFAKPKEVTEAIKRLKKLFGKPPEDLE